MKQSCFILATCLVISLTSCQSLSREFSASTETTSAVDQSKQSAIDDLVRATVRDVWDNMPHASYDEIATYVDDVFKKSDLSEETLRGAVSEEELQSISDDALSVATLIVEIEPSAFLTIQQYYMAMEDVLQKHKQQLSKAEYEWLHYSAVIASELMMMKYGRPQAFDNNSDVATLAHKSATLRAYEPYGQREANAFSHLFNSIGRGISVSAGKVKDWWNNGGGDCMRSIVAGAVSSGSAHPKNIIMGAIVGAVSGCFN